MNSSLDQRLRCAFPSGLLWEPDESVFGANEQQERLDAVLVDLSLSARVEHQPAGRQNHKIVITSKDAPAFNDWIWRFDNAAKIDWIRRNASYYVALWLTVSCVADYYFHYFNHWHPRGETGYLDADFRIEPNAQWTMLALEMEQSLSKQGFQHATRDIGQERTPFVLKPGFDEIPEDDSRWDDPDFEPPLVRACVFDCLFGDH